MICSLPFITGCAFGNREIFLRNSELANNNQPEHKRNHEICLKDFFDTRGNSNVGHVQNGYGMHTAEVIATNSVPEWVGKEIKNQLLNAGYVVNENCKENENGIFISGKIVKVYTTAYMSFLGEVTIKATIKLDTLKIVNKTYSGYIEGGMNWAASGGAFRDILEQSLKSVTKQLIQDIDSIDNIKPFLANAASTISENSRLNINKSDSIILPIQNITVQNEDTFPCPNEPNGFLRLSGKRDKCTIESALDSIKSDLQSVYCNRFELNPTLAGSICVYFCITPRGSIKGIKIIKNTLHDKPLEDKIIELLSQRRFDVRVTFDTTNTEVTCNFQFAPQTATTRKGVWIAVLVILGVTSLVLSFIHLSQLPTY